MLRPLAKHFRLRIAMFLCGVLLLAPSAPAQDQTTIVLDPGHGGKDSGAISRNGWYEKNITLDISKKVFYLLTKNEDYQVYMTRYKDVYVPLARRRDYAYRRRADLFVSIHCDGHRNTRYAGVSVFTLSERGKQIALDELEDNPDLFNIIPDLSASVPRKTLYGMLSRTVQKSRLLAGNIINGLQDEVDSRSVPVKNGAFTVLKLVNISAVLVEVGFITNPQESYQLQENNYRLHLAQGIVDGINAYLNPKKE